MITGINNNDSTNDKSKMLTMITRTTNKTNQTSPSYPTTYQNNGNCDVEMLLPNASSKSIINIQTCVGSHVLTQRMIMLHILITCNYW